MSGMDPWDYDHGARGMKRRARTARPAQPGEGPDLFGVPPAEVPPSAPVDTSEAAADSVRTRVARLRRRVLAAVAAGRGGRATCDEVEVQTGLAHTTASPRIWEMASRMDPPLLRRTEEKRATRAGRAAYAYELTSEGRAALAAGDSGAGRDSGPEGPRTKS